MEPQKRSIMLTVDDAAMIAQAIASVQWILQQDGFPTTAAAYTGLRDALNTQFKATFGNAYDTANERMNQRFHALIDEDASME